MTTVTSVANITRQLHPLTNCTHIPCGAVQLEPTGVIALALAPAQVSRFHTEANEDYAASGSSIELKQVCLAVSGKELLDDAMLSLHPGHCYGLMGPNGCGKTTLMRQLALRGKLIPQHIPSLLVEQEDVGDGRSPLDTVLAADVQLTALLGREKLLQAALDAGDPDTAAAAVTKVSCSIIRC